MQSVSDYLMEHYNSFPATGSIIRNSDGLCITPKTEADIDYLNTLKLCEVRIVIPPQDPITIIVAVLVTAAVTLALTPKIPNAAAARNIPETSPNNGLSSRTNSVRIGARRPSIFGQVNAVPDLLTPPYSVFDNTGREIEHSYMFVSEGVVSGTVFRDGATQIKHFPGSSIALYHPGISPIHGSKIPAHSVGQVITEPFITTKRMTSVNGQTLTPPNTVQATDSFAFVGSESGNPEGRVLHNGSQNLSDKFDIGEEITIGSTVYNGFNYQGIYKIVDIQYFGLIVEGAENWPTTVTPYASRTISVVGLRWEGPFIIDNANSDGFILNLVSSNGMYKDNGENQFSSSVQIKIEVKKVDSNDNPIGTGSSTYTFIMQGSAVKRDSVNKTFRSAPPSPAGPDFPAEGESGRLSIRIARSSDKDLGFSGQVVDDVKIKDLYSYTFIGDHDIDNTRIRASTVATDGALSLKERKLVIADATRHLPRYENGTFTTELYPTKSAADALISIALDPLIGRRALDELGVEQIYQTVENIKAYFGDDTAADFSYTLDSSDLTYEDTFAMIAQSIFCKGYRRSAKHYLSFEKKQSTSTLLFNHRNKIPNSETRRIQFGIRKNADGATCKWIDTDGIERIVSVPSAHPLQPIEVPQVGLNEFQATKHAWREWNKARYQNLFTKFDATSEAALSVLGQRVLVADNVSGVTHDGEVLEQDGLNLELSQDVPEAGWIHLQLPRAEMQAIQFTKQSANKITLLNPTLTELSTSAKNYARATYLISESSYEEQAFLLLERSGDKQYSMTLGNYDDRFYQHDQSISLASEHQTVDEDDQTVIVGPTVVVKGAPV